MAFFIGWVVRDRQGIWIVCSAARPVMGPTQLSIQWVPVVLSSRINGPESEVEYLRPSIVEIKNIWSCTTTTTRLRSKHMVQFTLKTNFTSSILLPGKSRSGLIK